MCDKKKEVFDDDIRALIGAQIAKIPEVYTIETLTTASSTLGHTTAAITIKKDGEPISEAALGHGTVDAIFKVIDRASGNVGELKDYKVSAVSKGKDALAKVDVKVAYGDKTVIGHGLDVDTMTASAKAYIGALNSYLHMLSTQN